MAGTATTVELKRRLRADEELALVDVREEVEFHENHLLFAANLPLSRLEQLVEDLIPRKSVPVVLCDAGDGLATRAAKRFAWLGYTDVCVLDGGTRGWEAAGGLLFAGANVPSKAFGEFVEHEYRTPRIEAADLKARVERGDNIVILDSRPWEEYRLMSIPGGIDCPGAELVYRATEAIPSSDTLVIVNCAGRTRSIIGTQSLINAGLGNQVMALKDGTMGWELAGFTVARHAEQRVPAPSAATIDVARRKAVDVARRAGVRMADAALLDRFRAECAARTLYLFDVRTPEEYEAGHVADALHAFGGQLVQSTDRYVAVRGARIVLVDDTEARALMTASWLRQMGWDEVYVLAGGMQGQAIATGRRRTPLAGLQRARPPMMQPTEAARESAAGRAAIIDLADPRRFKTGHVAGAWYAVRSRLPEGLDRLGAPHRIVITSSDGGIAQLAAAELADAGIANVAALDGGTAAWHMAGLPLESGEARLLHPRIEMWSPYEDAKRTPRAMMDYLSWEVDLYERSKRDGDAHFRKLPPA